MKVSERWLREWVDPAVDSRRLAHQLTMAGLEVDTVEQAAPEFSSVVVGEVTDVQPHPDADKLRLCRVRVGESEEDTLQIVCGASNVEVGMRAPTALVGARLPGDMKIRRSKLRGVESHGMLCSAVELGLAEQSDGLMRLPDTAPVGTDMREYLDLDDLVYTLELTPNRGDCLSIQGVAREVGAINALDLRPPDLTPVTATSRLERAIRIDVEQACPRYIGRIVDGLDSNAESPLWLRERLRRSGLRPVSAIVDVTNYVMLELGQPLHAFDDEKLSGDVQVRMADPGERFTALSGDELALDEQCLVIADDGGAVALAGVMGGAHSAVGGDTRRVFLESAYFSSLAVAGRGRQFKLHTDALHRYERGVDPDLQARAIERATRLLLDIVGGEAGPIVEVDRRPAAQGEPILLRRARVQRLLGADIAADEIGDILRRLHLPAEARDGDSWAVWAPSFRHDIALEADLVEEVGRLYGFERLPFRERQVASRFTPVPETKVALTRIRQVLIQRGYQEAITYSFSDPGLARALDPEASPIPVDNPIAETMGEMRTTLWAGLLPAWVHNLQRQQARVRLFEIGGVFRDGPSGIEQEQMLSGLVGGQALPEQWGAESREADFFDIKGDVHALMSLGGAQNGAHWRFLPERHPALHPGQSARIYFKDQPVGWCGRLHPRLAAVLDVRQSCLLFEISLKAVDRSALPVYQPVSEFPSVRRDLALAVSDSVSAADILECIRRNSEATLVDVFPFDLYRGKALGEGQKSIAFGLIFQDNSRTLKVDQVDQAVERIRARLEDELGASIRG